MKKIIDFKQSFGRLEIFTKNKLFLVKPSGIINPSLVKKDLELAAEFGSNHKDWIYLVNTEGVLFPNPLNLFYLSKIKNLPNRSQYIIYAPSIVVQVLGKITNFIIRPDLVIKNKSDYESFLKKVSK